MALTEEQVKEIRNQLSEQIQHLAPEQRAEAQKQIDSMSTEALESMLKQQMKQRQSQKIFRQIVSGEIPSVKVDENSEAIAVLDILPISEGHVVIIPKSPAKSDKEIPKSVLSFAEEISKKLKANLKALSIETIPEIKFGEAIINLIPIYDKPLDLSSSRAQSTPEKLKEIALKINTIKIEKRQPEQIKIEKKTPEPSQVEKLSRRIP